VASDEIAVANPSFEELKKAGLSVHEVVNATFAGTQQLLKVTEPIKNVTLQLGANRTELEDALAGTYYRMCLLMESLTRLNHKNDFQVALHCARLMYELYLDIVDLIRDASLLSKIKAFTFVARFAAAEKLVRELDRQGITDATTNPHERQFVANPANQKKFDAERLAHWKSDKGKPRTPMNWMDQTLPERTATIGDDELLRYRRLYSMLCWYSHAGIVGIANISAEGLESAMGLAHGHSQDFFFAATTLIANKFDIYKANPALKPPIEEFKQTTAKMIVAYMQQLQPESE